MHNSVLGVGGAGQRQPVADGVELSAGGGKANARPNWRLARKARRPGEQERPVGEGGPESQLPGSVIKVFKNL